MPHYFFDIDDGKHHIRDERGRVFANEAAAVGEALNLLKTLRDVHGLQHRPGVVAIVVRDDKGSPIFEGSVDCDGG